MPEIDEEKISQQFSRRVQGLDKKLKSNDTVEEIVTYTNMRTGLRDVIELFVASIFTLLLRWVCELNVKTQKTFLQSGQTPIIIDKNNKS